MGLWGDVLWMLFSWVGYWGSMTCRVFPPSWMEACLGEGLPPPMELEETLRNGVLLAKLGHCFAPAIVPLKKIYDPEQTRYKVRLWHQWEGVVPPNLSLAGECTVRRDLLSLRDGFVAGGCNGVSELCCPWASQALPLPLTSCLGWVGLGARRTPGMGNSGIQPDLSSSLPGSRASLSAHR